MRVPREILHYGVHHQRWLPWRRLSIVAVISAIVYWRFADWWAYVGRGPTAWPKFQMPLWWQIIESSIVGLVVACGVWLVWFMVRRIARVDT